MHESLTNIARHADVRESTVTLIMTPIRLHVSIADSGKGFDVNSIDAGNSTGLSSMAERVDMAGGHFTMRSSPGKGTFVAVDFALKTEE